MLADINKGSNRQNQPNFLEEAHAAVWHAIMLHVDAMRDEKEARDIALGQCNQSAQGILVRITSDLDSLGRAAIGGLPYRVAALALLLGGILYRDAVGTLRVVTSRPGGPTSSSARGGMEPALRYIASVGERLEKLRERLQRVKEDILQNSINYQTEATRDNTHKLERIQSGVQELVNLTQYEKQARGAASSLLLHGRHALRGYHLRRSVMGDREANTLAVGNYPLVDGARFVCAPPLNATR